MGEVVVGLAQLLASYFSTPQGIVSFVVQLLLGLGAGYFLAKGLKYILAFFAILVVGDLLNVWAVSGLNLSQLTSSLTNATAVEAQLKQLAPLLQMVYPLLTNFIVLIGFLIGVAIAFLK